MLSGWEAGGVIMAPLSSILMSAATASTTAGATISSASFAQTVLASGVAAVWAAAMTNAGATVLDHLPHGSFFHATGGSVGMHIKERMKLIPYETAVGLVLTLLSVGVYMIFGQVWNPGVSALSTVHLKDPKSLFILADDRECTRVSLVCKASRN